MPERGPALGRQPATPADPAGHARGDRRPASPSATYRDESSTSSGGPADSPTRRSATPTARRLGAALSDDAVDQLAHLLPGTSTRRRPVRARPGSTRVSPTLDRDVHGVASSRRSLLEGVNQVGRRLADRSSAAPSCRGVQIRRRRAERHRRDGTAARRRALAAGAAPAQLGDGRRRAGRRAPAARPPASAKLARARGALSDGLADRRRRVHAAVRRAHHGRRRCAEARRRHAAAVRRGHLAGGRQRAGAPRRTSA